MNLLQKKSIKVKEKPEKKAPLFLTGKRIINKITKIKQKNLRKKISRKRIRQNEKPTTTALFFAYLSAISKKAFPEKNFGVFLAIQPSLFILVFLHSSVLRIYIVFLQLNLFICCQNLCDKGRLLEISNITSIDNA